MRDILTYPPTAAELRARRVMLLELELEEIRRRIARLELAQGNAFAWAMFNLAAMALELDAPADELAKLWFAESLLEAALAFELRL